MKSNLIFRWIGVLLVIILFSDCQKKDDENLLPEAYFGVSDTVIRVGENVSFIDLSIHSINSCVWDFGDGSESTESNPRHKYSTDGTYTVSLTASNSYGSDTETKTNCIRVLSNAIVFNPNLTYGSVTDIDSNTYKTIQIGTQTWMAENLKTTHYNDGSEIPWVGLDVLKSDDYLTTPAYYFSNSNTRNSNTRGAYYNWYAVNTAKLAPSGWHVPTRWEWETLINYLGGPDVAGGKLKEVDIAHWNEPNEEATNESGFTAISASIPFYFDYLSGSACWWSATAFDDSKARYFLLTSNSSTASNGFRDKGCFFSVRCVKD